MGELTITDNVDNEIACLVDVDEYRPLGIVAVGPNRVEYLQAFVNGTPFDLSALDPTSLRDAFVSFLERQGGLGEANTQDNPPAQVESPGSNGSDDGAALAEREAVDSTGTPSPQPADADPEADQGTKTIEVRCWNCNGEGVIRTSSDGVPDRCNLCEGKGTVTQKVAA